MPRIEPHLLSADPEMVRPVSDRMRSFKQALRSGQTVTDATYDAGFGSASRVYGKPERQIGMAPSRYQRGGEGERIAYACRKTALGLLMTAATDKGVCFAEFGDDEESLCEKWQLEFPKARLAPSQASESRELTALTYHWISAAPPSRCGSGNSC